MSTVYKPISLSDILFIFYDLSYLLNHNKFRKNVEFRKYNDLRKYEIVSRLIYLPPFSSSISSKILRKSPIISKNTNLYNYIKRGTSKYAPYDISGISIDEQKLKKDIYRLKNFRWISNESKKNTWESQKLTKMDKIYQYLSIFFNYPSYWLF